MLAPSMRGVVSVGAVLVTLALASCCSRIVDTRFVGSYTCSQSGYSHKTNTGSSLSFGSNHTLTLRSDGTLSVQYFNISRLAEAASSSADDQYPPPSVSQTYSTRIAQGRWWMSDGRIAIRLPEANISIIATPSPSPDWSVRSSEVEQNGAASEYSGRELTFDDGSRWERGLVSSNPTSAILPRSSPAEDLEEYMRQIGFKIADAVDRMDQIPSPESEAFSALVEDLVGNPEVQGLLFDIIMTEYELADDIHGLTPEQLEASLLEEGALTPRLCVIVAEFLEETYRQAQSD